MRTDNNNNPAAVTTDVAAMGLLKGVEYVEGDPFPQPSALITARLIGDPVALTIKLIDKIGYYTRTGGPRWIYIAVPAFIWNALAYEQKRDIVGFHYQHEGGVAMRSLFPYYGKL